MIFYLIMILLKLIKALSHENRLRILNLISQQDLCVCEIEHIMQINQSNASRHLSKLKQANLIYGEKKAQWIYYHIKTETIEEYQFIKLLLNHELDKLVICQEDNKRLKEYQESDLSCQDIT